MDPVTADDVLTVQFTHIKKGGYAQQEVDAFLDRIAATLDHDPSLMPPSHQQHMLRGYELIHDLCDGLAAYMEKQGVSKVEELVGLSLPYFTTHADLVLRQQEAKREKAGLSNRDSMWQGDISKETDTLVTD